MSGGVDNPRAIIDRRGLTDALAALPEGAGRDGLATNIFRTALEQGRAEIARRLDVDPDRGRSAARATAYLHDQLVRSAYDFASGLQVVPGLAYTVALGPDAGPDAFFLYLSFEHRFRHQ